MNIYVINIFITFVWALLLLVFKPTERKKKTFIGFATLQWILISGLRHVSVGDDTFSYKLLFNKAINLSWKSVIPKMFVKVYVEEEGKDPGYIVFEKVIQLFTKNYQWFLVIVAVLFFVCLAFWIFKNSKLPCFSFILFSVLLYKFFAITGIRQTIATAIVVLIGTEFIKKRKFFPFLFVCLIAFTIHKSSIVFLPFYFISQKKITLKYSCAVLACFPILYIFRNQYVELLRYVSGYEYDALENSGAYGFTILYLAVTVASLFLIKYVKQNTPYYKIYYNALFMGLIFLPAVFVNPALMRVVQYFSIFLMLLIPEMICAIEKKYRPIVYTVVVGVLMLITNVYNQEYLFFWQ